MSNSLLTKEYKIKIYLNARHYILINGNKGQTHPHTWEFTLDMVFPGSSFIAFSKIEKELNVFLEQYQDQVLNDLSPFNIVTPTLENITDDFSLHFSNIIKGLSGKLLNITASETPTRSYVVNVENQLLKKKLQEDEKNAFLNQIIDLKLSKMGY